MKKNRETIGERQANKEKLMENDTDDMKTRPTPISRVRDINNLR